MHRSLIASVFALCAWGAAAQEMSAYWVYGGALNASAKRSFHSPAASVRDLPLAAEPALPPALAQEAEALATSDQRVTLTLVDKGRVVYRHRRIGVQDDSFVISYSMAKSVTALLVGHALCAGHIKDLNEPLGNYVPELADTVYGRSAIRHVLNMASGADASGSHGEPYPTFSSDLRDQKTSYIDNLLKYKNPQRRLFSTLAPGDAFDYKNLDTAALSLLLEKATQRPMQQWYEDTLVPAAGLARTSAWMLDRDNRAVAHGFLFASPDDWVRIALYSLDAYKGRAGACLQGFLQQGVSQGVRVYNNAESTRYGHQLWTGTPGVNAEVFWMRGYGGQYIGVDPVTERVLVAASRQPNTALVDFFRRWVNTP